jgi:proton-dependent oligopeptide transporter, POT family
MNPPAFNTLLGHPRPLWMLFMTEFWERFAYYGMRWALTLYIVAEFFNGDTAGQGYASRTYGSYLALVYATSIFGGYVADQLIGYQRAILLGAVLASCGLFTLMLPDQQLFLFGLALIIIGIGLFKPNISTMVGMLYSQGDPRRDRGFTLFYMGINAGALVAPLITGWLASTFSNTPMVQNYKAVFFAAGVGMLISMVWFWFGCRQLQGVGAAPVRKDGKNLLPQVTLGALVAVPLVYLLLSQVSSGILQWVLSALFIWLAIMLLSEGLRSSTEQRDRVLAMLILFAFNVLFWCFFEQAGSSFNFLAQNIVDRDFSGWQFPVGWFQSVNPLGIVLLAPIVTLIWGWMSRQNFEPSIARKFGLGLMGNALGFWVLMYALTHLVSPGGQIPFWPLAACYLLQTLGELCLSPIGLSMVTKLAPVRYVGFAMGGWFLSIAIGSNLSGMFAGYVSGEKGLTTASALEGFSFSFYLLLGAGIVLFLVAPWVNRLMHGVK